MSSGRARVISEPLGGSALSQALQAGRLPAGLQPWRPQSVDEWRTHAQSVARQASRAWYAALAPALNASDAAKERIERVVREGGVVVTTGQQASLFGGPLYTLAKAVTALEIANEVERELGVAAAPVFWAATDDADFLEASIAFVADAHGLHELRLGAKPPSGTPMSHAPLGDTIALLNELRVACGSAANAEYLALVERHFADARCSVGDAYVALMRSLLEPLGVAVLDSSHAAYSATARPLLTDALRKSALIAQASHDRAEEIRKAGFEPQVEDDRGLTLLAVMEKRGKRRVSVEEAPRFKPHGDDTLAPNVLLRPIVEAAILPTIAYVGGPAELAYFVQSNAVADVLGRPPVVGVPRWSGTVVEPFAERALSRLGAAYHELRDVAALEKRLAAAAIPPQVAHAWASLQESVHAAILRLRDTVDETQLLPHAVIDGLRNSLDHRLQRGERRLLAAVKRREERIHTDLRVAAAALYPNGERQERVLNYIPMLVRGGATLMEDLRAGARAHAAALLRASRIESVATR
ncbi:MAG TPA: bacillithiol biosynthesis BshC [Gemmatimonadaceae bacterium]|nr:bacillithiol biosynthesis BshC [Gemmatimonadaceae bacterium]